MIFNKKDYDSKQRFSIRKLNIGVCSVLLSTLFLTFGSQQVHAAENKSDANSNTPKTEIAQSKEQGKQSDASSATNSTSDNAAAQSKKSAALSKNISDTGKTASINSSKTDDKTNNSSASSSNTDDKTNSSSVKSDKSTVLQKGAAQSDLTGKDAAKQANAQDDSKNNTIVASDKKADADASQLLNDSKIQLKKAKADAPANDPVPVPLHYEIGTNYIYVVVGTDIKDDPARLFKNGQELLNAGAKLSWVTDVPTFTNADYNTEKPATIRVTYADGKHTDVNVQISGEPQVKLQPKTFYYVKNVGDKVDFSQPDSNYNDYDTIMDANGVYNTDEISYEPVKPIDTSTVGIHWAKIKVTDNGYPDGITKVVGDPYYVEIPYIVQGLKLRDDIPKDAAGNPIINAQLASQPQGSRGVPTAPVLEFAPSNGNTSLLGQYFYQDYALAYALGITTSIDGWTQPTDLINTKSNSFKLVLNYNNGSGAYKLGDSKEQTIDVHYVAAPHIDNIYFYNDGHTYMAGVTANLQTVKEMVDSGMLNKYIYVTLADGTKVYAKTITSIRQLFKGIGGSQSGQFQAGFKATFGGTNSAGQPLIFSSDDLGNVAGAGFNNAVNYWYKKTNDTYDTANFGSLADNTWDRLSTTAYALAPTVSADQDKLVADVTDGPITYTNSDTGNTLSAFVENPDTAEKLNKYLKSINADWKWLPENSNLNTLSNNNTKWPEGTKFEWTGNDGSKTLAFDKAGEIKTGKITITLPSGEKVTVKNITVRSKANVKTKNETIDYGTKLKAEDLVTNKNAFPEGTTYQFAKDSTGKSTEPTWIKSGSYNKVQITATYKEANGKTITTDASTCVVVINSTRPITVLKGSSVPTVDSILNFPEGWESHTANWSTDINTNGSNQGEITVYYPSAELYQKIGVYVTVIPKTTVIDGEQFLTNGKKYDGTAGSIANGTTNQGSILTNAGDNPISYQGYQVDPNNPNKFNQVASSYSPSFSLSGLKTNADGSLVSGVQNVTVRVSVPKGTFGADHDKDGNYYYELKTNIEVAQPVTFEFVDDADSQTVGTPQTQEFLKGQAKAIAPDLVIPTNYELATGQTLPTSYTLTNYVTKNPVVQIHLRKDITVSFTGNDSKTYDGQPASVSVDTLSNAITSTDTDTGHNLDVSGLTTSDFDWYQGSTKLDSAPTAVGDYTIKLNDTGLRILKNNNKNYALTLDSKKQSYTYVISAAPATVTFQGQASKTYDGTAATLPDDVDSASHISANLTNHESLDLSGLSANDFDWYQGSTKLDSAPTSVGDYTIKLNNTGLTALKNKNKNYTLTLDSTKSYTYTIKKAVAAAALTGSNQMTYSGNAATTTDVNAGGHINVTISIPNSDKTITYTLQDGDYTWKTTDGSAPSAAGSYTINLNKDNILSHLQAKIAADATWKGNVDLTNANLSGSATFDIKKADANVSFQGSHTKTYDGTAATIPSDAKTASDITATGLKHGDSLDLTGLTDTDFDWYDQTGTHKFLAAPTAAGNYTIKLNADGLDKLQSNKNYKWGDVAGTYTYTIKKASASAALAGSNQMSYSGSAATTTDVNAGGHINVTISIPHSDKTIAYTLQDGDYTWNTSDGSAPIAAGNYTIQLNSAKILSHLQAKIAADSTWKGNVDLTDDDLKGLADFTINKGTARVALSGSGQRTYNGSVVSDNDIQKQDANNNINLKVTFPGQTNPAIVTLKVDDFDWSQGTTKLAAVPKDAGTYNLTLNAAGKQAIATQLSSNHNIDWDHVDFTHLGSATYTINKATASAALSGSGERTYNGSAVNNDDIQKQDPNNNIALKITIPGVTDPQTITLTVNDFDWSQGSTKLTAIPTAAGTYNLALNDNGKKAITKKFGSSYTNIDWERIIANGSATYTINKATASVTMGGRQTETYDGTAKSLDLSKFKPTFASGTLTMPTIPDGTFTADDYTIKDSNGTVVSNPINAGTYKVYLNANGIDKIKKLTGAGNFTWPDASSINTYGELVIKQTEATAKLSGTNKKTYNGKAVTTTELNSNGQIIVTITVNGQTITYQLQDGDYTWNTTDGSAPSDVDSYTINLNKDNILSHLQAKIAADATWKGNVDLTDTNLSGSATFKITAANATVSFTGDKSKTYDGTAAILPDDVKTNTAISANLVNYESLDLSGLTDADFDWYQGNTKLDGAPTAVGDYTIKLNDTGLTALKNKNKNYTLTLDAAQGYAYHITAATATISFSGTHSETYNGTAATLPNDAKTNTAISASGLQGNDKVDLSGLSATDFDWFDQTGTHKLTAAPKDAGNYIIKLNADGLAKLQANKNYNWGDVTGTYTYTINKANPTAVFVGDGSKTYDGSAIDHYTTPIGINIDAPGTVKTISLTAGTDYVWTKDGQTYTSAPTEAGNYSIELTDTGKTKIENVNAANLDWKDTDITGTGTYNIKQAPATVKFTDNSGQKVEYNGKTGQFDPSKFVPIISTNNGQTLNVPSDLALSLADGDFAFAINGTSTTTEPTEVGSYTISLTAKGLAKLEARFSNAKDYDWSNVAGATYTINKAGNIKVTISDVNGGQKVDYNDTIYSNNDIVLDNYKVTLANGLTFTLQKGDLEFVPDENPLNVGTYHVELSTQAQNKINNLDTKHYSSYDFSKAIGTFTINKAIPTVQLHGTGSKTYDGKGPQTGDFTERVGLKVTAPGNPTIDLVSGDYEFVGQDGTHYASPINVGTYTIVLTTQGRNKILNNTDNGSNLDWSKVDLTNIGTGSFTIKAAEGKAVLGGKGQRTYNGSTVTDSDLQKQDSNNDITVTISIPNSTKTIAYTLQNGDYNWENGSAPVKAGTYTIDLNKDSILAHLKDKIAADSDWKGNVALTADDLSGSATFTINKAKSTVQLTGNGSTTYNGKQVTTPVSALQQNIRATTPVNNEKLDVSGLSADDFDWYDANGTKLTAAPTNAGTYIIRLNNTGLAALNQKNGNYALTLSNINNGYTYKINPLIGSVVFNGSHTETYSGKANTNPTADFSLALNADNKNGYSYQQTYNLKVGDVEYQVNGEWTTSVPINVGKYRVRLTNQGWQGVKKFNGGNISWAATIKYANKDAGYYIITTASASAKLSGSNHRNYNGSTVTTGDINANGGNIQVVLTFTGATTADNTFTLRDGQYTWQTTGNVPPKDAGTYTIKLNNTGLTALQNYIDSVAGEGNVKLDVNNMTGSATFTINKVAITVSQSGSSSKTYNGQPATMPTTDLTNNISNDGGMVSGETLNIPSLSASDFDWYDANGNKLDNAPTDAGNYTIKLNSNGLKKLQDNNTNYSFATVGGSYSYMINKGQASATLSGQGKRTYNGSAITDADIQKQDADNNITLTITIPGQSGSQTITLSVNDFDWVDQVAVPSDAGTYTLTLNANGKKAIKGKFGTNQNIDWSQINSDGTAKFTINPLAITVKQNGSSSKTYDGNAASVSLNNDLGNSISSDDTITGHKLITSGFTASDFDWFDNKGNKLTSAPTDVGKYKIKLNSNGLKHLQDSNKNYSFTNVDGSYTYAINPADATATLKGSGSHEYNGQAAKLSEGSYSVDLGHGLSYTLQDGDYTWSAGSAPIDAGNYKIVLTQQGKDHIKAVSGNYNWNFDSQATFDVTAQEMGLVVDGNASKNYDGEIAKITADDLKGENGVHIKWGNNESKPTDITFTLSPDDFEVVGEDGKPVSAANVKNSVIGETYYIRLTQTALDKIQKQNKNYKFILDQANNNAFYFIYARKAALTLTGNQTTTYGTDLKFDPNAYTLDFSNWVGDDKPTNITFNDGDLSIQGAGSTYSDGAPINAGTYKVIINKQLVDRLQKKYTNYDFYPEEDNPSSGVDDKHQPATYIVQPMQIGVKINGDQKVQYGSANYNNPSIINNHDQYSLAFDVASRDESTFNSFKLKAGDLEFVKTPDNVGTYQVRLTKQGIDDLKAISGINPANYDWDVLVKDLPTANFEVTQKPITIKQANSGTKVYDGKAGSVTLDELINGLNSQDLISGQTLNTSGLSMTDFTWSDADHINVGTYHISLTADGLKKLQDDNANYSFDSAESFTYTITKAKASATLNGRGQRTYNGYAVSDSDVQKHDANNDISISITIPGQSGTQTITLAANDFDWNNESAVQTNAGTYTLTLNANGLNAIKDKFGTNQNIDWNNTIITNNATYTIKAATGTAKLSGSVEQDYNGQAITDLSPIKVTVDYPNTDNQTTYTLVSGDYEFVKGSKTYATAPVDAGTYTIQLTDQGKANIKKLGNPTGQTNVDWTISGTGTYTINSVAATVTVSGSQTEIYDGSSKSLNVSNFKPTFASGNLTMPTIPAGTFTADDYTIEDSNGSVVSDPINAGIYKVYLNANGIAKIKKLAGADNFTWPDAVNTYGTLTINKVSATAKLDGHNSKVYDGQGVTTADLKNGGSIAVTITVNGQTITYKLQNGDYTWNIPDGSAPINVGNNYSISLNKDAILAHLKDEIDKDKSELKGNYQLTANDLSGTATFTITQKDLTITQKGSDSKTYDGTAGSVTPKELTDGLSAEGLAKGESLNTDGLTLADFDWSDAIHSKAGSYTITLNAAGLAKLKSDNPNYSFDHVGGSFTYTINKATASAILSGHGQSTYNGLPVTNPDIQNSSIKLTVTIPGQTNPSTVRLLAEDFDWSGKAAVPTDSATYTLTLNDTGKKAISDQLGSNTNIDWSKTTVTGQATYTIIPAAGTIVLHGSDGKTFDNQATTKVNNGKFTITINGVDKQLVAGQYQIVDAQGHAVSPKNVGTYYVVLTDDAVKQLEKKDTNYIWTITPNGTLNNELGTYKISPANVTVNISGSGSKTYDGKAASDIKDSGVQVTLTGTSALGSITYNWQDDDFVWYQGTTQINAPLNAGSYIIKLDAAQLQNFLDNKFGNGDVVVSGVNGQADFTIKKAIPKVTFHGEGSKVYDGQPITDYTTPIGLNITNDPNAGNDPITLIAGTDYVWTKDGHTYNTAPVDVGDYTIELTNAGKNKIHNATANADNLDWSKVDLTKVGTGTYIIKAKPTNPQPTGPQPTNPPKPDKPTEPAKPTKPGKPTKPAKPAKPNKPGHKPGKPNKPGKQPQHHGSAQPTRRPGYNHNGPAKSQTTRWSSNNRPLHHQMPSISHHYLAVGPEEGESRPSDIRGHQSSPSALGNRSDRYDQNGKLLPQTGSHNTSFLTILGLTMTSLAALFSLADRKKKKR